MKDRILDRFARLTQPSRERLAIEIFMYGRPSPWDKALASAFYSIAASRWDAHVDDPSHLEPFVAGLVTCRPPSRALDIGTGAGGSAAAIAARFPSACVTGIDLAKRMPDHARARHVSLANLEFVRASSMKLPWPDGTFDLASCINAVPEPVELHRVTAAGAEVLVASTYQPVRPVASAWVGRFAECGFDRADAADIGRGSWERYVRR
jgi:SAM-dependent methyltransferase